MNRPIVQSSQPRRPFAWERGFPAVLALLTPLLLAERAAAQTPCGEQVCEKGYTCETAQGVCPAIACVDENCPPCEPRSVSYCVPAACTADADCGDGMVCAEFTQPCAETAPAKCPPNTDCSENAAGFAPPVDCTPTTKKVCTPRWQLPCAAAADCGPGFECVEREACSSPGSSGSGAGTSGSAGTPTPGAPTPPNSSSPPSEPLPAPAPKPGETDAPEPPEVTCEPTGEFACVPIVTACTSDSSCPAGWSCADNPNGACTRTPEGETHCVADPAKICVPPHSGYPGNGGPGEGTTTGLPEAPGSNPPNNSGTPEPAGAPGGGEPLDTAAPESNTSSSGGCSMSPVPTPPSALALVALGLAAAFGFRRRR